MGSVFGKETVLEPQFKTILERTSVVTTYQIREYGKRFAAEVDYSDAKNTGSPFGTLAKYIGVFGDAQNEGTEAMEMTAPVSMERKGTQLSGEDDSSGSGSGNGKKMKFFLPQEYDELEKIPKPKNPNVKIVEIPPVAGAAYRYSGSLSDTLKDQKALEFSAQLRNDGLDRMTPEHVLQNYQFWGFNPPFTIPMYRRNEIWLDLTQEEANMLQEKFQKDEIEQISN
mmetsp:Transcript_67873/g.75991  ORF Transcript_67873/g.75991 Transcript_67873/m.75991 type:complete len:226 (-) Transcript_67873:128-805(-)